MRFAKTTIVLAVAMMALGYKASANTVTINLGTVLNGAFVAGDQSSSPYLTATITDGTLNGNSGVSLSLTTPGLGFAGSANYEHVLGWDFAVNSTPGTITQTQKGDSNAGAPSPFFTNPTITSGTFNNVPGGGMGDVFNLQFLFAEGGGGGPPDGILGGTEFGHGDSVTYFIQGLNSSNFVVATKNNNPDTYYSAAQVDDAMGGTWVGGSTAIGGPTPTPLPASVWSGIVLVGGLAGIRTLAARRRRLAAV